MTLHVFVLSVDVFQKVTDIKHFSLSYWLLAFTIMFFYNGVFPFVADARYVLILQYYLVSLFVCCFTETT